MSKNQLIEAVEKEDLKYLSLLVSDGSELKKDQKFKSDLMELFNYFTKSNEKMDEGGYYIENRLNKLQKCVEILMPVMYDTPSKWGESFASWVLQMGVDDGDWVLFNGGFSYLALEEQNLSLSNGGGSCLLENAVVVCNENQLQNMPQKIKMIEKLAEKQKDDDGMALLRCVQKDLSKLFDVILPHSNIAKEHHFIYFYACGLENKYYMEKLKPLVDEVDAFYGVMYKLPYPPHDKEKEQFNRAREVIFKDIKNNPNNENKKLLLKIYDEDVESVKSYIKKKSFSKDMLIKMLEFAWEQNEDTYLMLLDFIPPGSMKHFDLNKLMIRNIEKFKMHVAPHDSKEKQSLFYNACHFNNKEAMAYFIENEFKRNEVMDLLATWKSRALGSTLPSLKNKRIKPHDNLASFIVEYDKKYLKQKIKKDNEVRENKKI